MKDSTIGRRIMVFVQPGVEVILVPSPLVGDPSGFTKEVKPLGKLVMNTKHSLWFEGADGERIHLAKAPGGKPSISIKPHPQSEDGHKK